MGEMDNFLIYHFAPLTHYRGAAPRVSELLAEGIQPVLDLEDSVQCIFDPARNLRLKALGRHGLRQLASLLAQLGLASGQVLIRMNHAATPHYAEDLAAVADCFKLGFQPGILLPKTECVEDMVHCQQAIQKATGVIPLVTPIIETPLGLANLSDILSALAGPERAAVFGYFDYAVAAHHWPMRSQFAVDFWELILPIREMVEQAGVRYVHTPYPHLTDAVGLLKIKSMLLATGRAAPGMCSLAAGQTKVLVRPVAPAQMRFESTIFTETEVSMQCRAAWVVDLFEQARANQRSFAISEGYFITPHEYYLAREFLQSQPGKATAG